MLEIVKYESWLNEIQSQSETIRWEEDEIKVGLLTSAYVPSPVNDASWNDVAQYEIPPCNEYNPGGKQIPNMTQIDENSTRTITGDEVEWLQDVEGFDSARYAVIYKDSGQPATSPLVGFIDFSRLRSNKIRSFIIRWNPLGILRFNWT